MSFERIIVNKLNEARRLQVTSENLNESWPPILNQLRSYDQNTVRSALKKAGIDIQNTPVNAVKLTSSRDPRLKGTNLCIFVFPRNNGIAVYFNGKTLVDCYVTPDKSFSQLPWKEILGMAKDIYVMEFDEEISKAMKDKQSARASAQAGTVNRYTAKNKPKRALIDKSGYIFDPNKYKNMLADIQLSQGTDVLKRAKEIYVKLANNIDKVDFENDGDYYNYEYIVRSLVNIFQNFPKYLKEYEIYKRRGYGEFAKNQVIESIKLLNDLINKAKKYL